MQEAHREYANHLYSFLHQEKLRHFLRENRHLSQTCKYSQTAGQISEKVTFSADNNLVSTTWFQKVNSHKPMEVSFRLIVGDARPTVVK